MGQRLIIYKNMGKRLIVYNNNPNQNHARKKKSNKQQIENIDEE